MLHKLEQYYEEKAQRDRGQIPRAKGTGAVRPCPRARNWQISQALAREKEMNPGSHVKQWTIEKAVIHSDSEGIRLEVQHSRIHDTLAINYLRGESVEDFKMFRPGQVMTIVTPEFSDIEKVFLGSIQVGIIKNDFFFPAGAYKGTTKVDRAELPPKRQLNLDD